MKKKLAGPPESDGAWVWHTIALKCSMAWRGRSHRAILFTEFLEVENLRHAGLENGNLLAPYGQLMAWGLRRETISDAIEENIKRKLVARTGGGIDLDTGQRLPFKYRLTYLPTVGETATNEWKKHRGEVSAKSPEKVEKAKRAIATRWAKKNQKPSTETGTDSVPKPVLGENQKSSVSAKNLVPKPVLRPSTETGTTIYISGVSTPSADHCAACDECSTGQDCPAGNVVWGEFGRAADQSETLPQATEHAGQANRRGLP
jgi:hypothetical protein